MHASYKPGQTHGMAQAPGPRRAMILRPRTSNAIATEAGNSFEAAVQALDELSEPLEQLGS